MRRRFAIFNPAVNQYSHLRLVLKTFLLFIEIGKQQLEKNTRGFECIMIAITMGIIKLTVQSV